MFGIAFFLLTVVLTQIFHRRSFLFQGTPTYAIFDREAQLGYWAKDGELQPVAWQKVRFNHVETMRRLSAGQWLHQHFLRIRNSRSPEGHSVEAPIAQTFDSGSGIQMVLNAGNALCHFMDGSSPVRADILDLREQPHRGFFRLLVSWVIPPDPSSRASPWSGFFGVITLPLVIPFFIFNAFFMGAVTVTSSSVRWPDELLSRIGEVPAGSQLEAVISSKT
ncbi:hypothetical protein GFK26_11995 [Variovorax paradoxus]|uniref:Uncharacterized protein n=1 Tax=Variovorax paradoxus TaxID=34073 RepID=A0A5Q0M4P5_VARPD|nr:hypothetical protein [Variovorax paradoxus]QFZ83435.1 hypothetical protein GFK26_11995 [Variovorax paradoxus]